MNAAPTNGWVARHGPAIAWIVAGCALSLLATLLDHSVYQSIVYARVYETDWGRALRMVGYWPTWIIVSIALWLDGRPPLGPWRAQVLALAVTVAGIGDEVLKLLIRRERPNAHDGMSVFRPFTQHPFSSAGLSTPSSHAVLAFAAAATMARLFPRSTWMWYLLAAGCAVTRLLARAHFFSDVVSGAFVGAGAAYIIAAIMQRRTLNVTVNNERAA